MLLEEAANGYPVGWFQPSYKSLLEVWRAVKRVLKPVTSSVSEQDKRIELINGGIVDFWSLDGDPEACRGRKYKRVIINEAAKARHLQLAWEQAIRATLTDYRGDAWFPSTPRGRDFYHELFERGRDTCEEYPSWKSWQIPTSSNPHIHPEELEEAKRDLPTTVWLQEYEAQFLDVAGRFFDEWEPERIWTDYDEDTGKFVQKRRPWHVVDPFEIPDWWKFWGAVDYGTTPTHKTFCFLLFCIDAIGTVYIVDEVYEAGMEAPEQAVAVLKCLKRNGLAETNTPDDLDTLEARWTVSNRVERIQFDWANTFPPEGQGSAPSKERQGKYPVEHYWDKGLTMCVQAVKDRRAGWREVKTFHHGFRVIRDEKTGEEDTIPLIRVFKGRCANLIRTLPQLIRSEKDPEDIEGGNARGGEKKQEDHPADAKRYGLMTRPTPSVDPKTLPRNWRQGMTDLESGEHRPAIVGRGSTISSRRITDDDFSA